MFDDLNARSKEIGTQGPAVVGEKENRPQSYLPGKIALSNKSIFIKEKNIFFILSTGRSGTKTIAKSLSEIQECLCLHEPAPQLILESSAYRYGRLDGKQLKQFVLKTRRSIVNGKIYGESNQTLSLIVPILAASFPRAKFIWLIRNGLDVVSSIFSRQWYTGHSANHERYEDCPPLEKAWIDGRIMGHLCGDVPFAKWEKMDPFARCCWYWAYVNRVIEKDLKDYCSTGSFRKIKLEELDQELPNLVKWLGLGSGTDLKCGRHNRAHYNLYPWQKWTSEERKTFLYWCGPLMDRLYPDWRILNREYFSFLHDTPKRIKLSIENNIQNQKNVRNINSTKDKLENLSVYFTPQLKTRPKISVYITSYNQKEYLFEAIESVLAQTLKPHQVIIVDDFSNDGSQELIAKYAQKYPNLILPIYHTKNLGVVKTRIDALNAVTGDYVTYVDGDDRFLPEKLERELNILAGNSNAQIAYSNNYYINPDGQRIGVWADETKPPQGYIFKETFARRFPKSNLFRMEVINYQVLKSVGFHDPDITIYEDFDLRIRLTKHFQVAFCDEPLSEIRLHKKGLSSLSANQHLASLELIYHKSRFLLADLNEHDREIAKKGFNDYVNKISQGAAKQLAENIKIKKQYSDKRPYEIISSNSSEDESHRANELGANLIFLISQPRSGSTLFQRLLAGHPEIHSTAEPWIMLHPIYALKEKGIETEYRSDLAMRGLADFLMQVPEGIELYKKALRKFGSTLYNRMIELSGKRFFLDKTPRYYHIISELNSIFPEANFIVLLRNPVAVLSSILKTWFENRVDDLETQSLIDMINGPVCLLDGIKKLKERAIVVDYESLVQSPETVMLRVCTRIGIPYYDNMLNYGKNPKPIGRFGDSVGVFQHSRPVTDNVDKWLKNISSAELVEFADEYLKTLGSDIVAKMGYNYEELKQKLDSQRPSWHNPQTNIESIRFLNKEGESLFAKGDIDAALNNLQKAFNLDPNDAVTNNNLGAIYYHKGKKEIALGYYQKATELMPENINFQKNLADFYYVELEKVEESLAVYIKILETNPNDIETLTALAKICSDLEKFEDAKQFYNRILALDPSNQIAKQRMENLINRNQRLPSVSCNCCEDCQTCLCGQDYLVSAVVSCYNSERFINGCLGDLENQTIADRLEIIIVNSGSRENEEKIIREFQAKYSNIKYIKTSQRETLYQAWNRGIKAASGRYITNANTDDRHKKDALEILARTLENHPEVGLAYADCLITENENETFESNSAKSCYIFPEFSVRQMLARQFFGPQPMWRKSVHEKIGYFNPEYIVAGDYDFFIRLGWKYGGIHIPEFLGLYCKRNNSVERANKEINIKEEYAVKTHYRNIIPIEDIYPSLKNCQGDPLAFAAAYADIGNFFIQIFNDNAAAKRAYQKGLGYQPDSFELLNNLYFLNKFEGNFKESKEIKKQLQANKGFVLNSSIVSNDCVQDPQKPEKTFLMKIQHPIVDESTPVIAGSLEHSIQDGKYLQKNIGKQCQQKALKNFNSALEKLNAGRFDLAADLMNNYRRLINYELFEKFDQRRQKSQDVSIIIVSYNSNDDLINCLRSLEKQTFRNFEVIIVDNGKNEAVRRELEAKSILLIHPPGNLFPAEGRNIGASFARGKIIAFLDDDATVQENYVEEIVQAFNKYEIYGLRGKILGKTDNPNNMVARHYDLGDIPIPATLDTEGNSAYLRDIYMEMRGMDPLLFGGEGLELSYRIARSYGENRTIYFPKTIIFHDFAPTNEKCAEKVHRHDFMKQYRVWKYPNIQRWQSQIDQFALNPHLKESAEKLIVKSSSANKPIVSVIVPLFNAAEFIAETLQSVIDQSYQDWETIIVNDGSTDNSVEIVQKLMRENPERRIHLIEQENQGETAARNRAIGACRGKYVLPLDADDKIHPHMLEKCVRVLEERPHISIVYTDVQEFGDKHRMIPAADYRLATLCKFNYIVSCALFRKEVWENVRGYNPNMKDCYEDWDFWIAAAEKGFVGQRIPEALFYYRKRNNSGYSRSLKRDKKAKAQIILNHQKLFTDRQINWAKCILNGDSVALGLELPLALMPIFSNDRTDPNISFARQNTEYHCAVTLPSSQKLSILFFMYGWLEEGGGTILPRQIARAFARRGHRMTVVYAASQNLPDKPPYYVKETEEAGVRLFGIYNRPEALYDPQHPEREIEDQSVRKIIAKIIGETKPDIVHYHNLHTLSMSVAEEVRQRGIPSVYTSHNYWLLCPRVYLFKQDLTLCDGPSPDGSKCAACIGQQNKQNDYAIRFERGRKLTDWCTDRHLAVSQRLRELFIKNGHKTGRIHVLQQQPETVEDIWRQVGSSRQIASDFLKPIKIGFIGSLLPQKGVHILLASMQSIAASDAECHIFGSGPESYVKFLQKQDNKGAIRFHGRYETKQLPNILKELDIVVVPSIWEDCAPLVVAEALAARCPVIGSRIGGIPDFIEDQINGFLFEPANSKDLLNILTRFINDPGLLGKLRSNIQQPKGFDTYLDELVDHYSDVIMEQKRHLPGVKVNSAMSLTPERTTLMTGNKVETSAQIKDSEMKKSESMPEKTSAYLVKWEGSQFVNHSLALVNRELCIELAGRQDIELSLIPYEPHEFGSEADPVRFGLIEDRLRKPLSGEADFHVRHQWPPNFTPPPEGHWIMIQPWEFGALPKSWVEPMRTLVDELWVPSNHVRDVYIKSGVTPDKVFVVPNGVNHNQFNPEAAKLKLNTDKRFKFLFVGGTIMRKGIDVLLSAYVEAFTAEDDVCLVIKDMGGESFYKGQNAWKIIEDIKRNPASPEILYLTETLNTEQIAGLYTACDCLVHPYRGEGFGLPVAEAMACALPVIVTRGGACDDFCSDGIAYLIDSKVRPVQLDGHVLSAPGWLLEPDRAHLIDRLRSVYKHPGQAKELGALAARQIRKKVDWKMSTDLIIERLRALRSKPIRRFSGSLDHKATQASKTPQEIYQTIQQSMKNKKPEKVIDELEMLTEFYPQFALAYNDLGVLHYTAGNKEKARQFYEKAVELDPDNLVFQKNLADFYFVELGRVEDALRIYIKALEANPEDIETLLITGHICVALHKFEDAGVFYRRVLELEPGNEAAQNNLDKLDKMQPIAPEPKSPQEMYQEIQPLLNSGDPNKAIVALEEFLQSYPDFALVHNDLGVLYYQTGDKEKARDHYERATRLMPENINFQKNLADFYCIELGRIEDALKIYVSILKTDPQDVETLMATGLICKALEKPDDARAFFNRVLEIEPWNTEARKQIEEMERQPSGENLDSESAEDAYRRIQHELNTLSPAEAIIELEKLVELHPNFAIGHNDLGVLYYNTGNKEKALQHYQQAVNLQPENMTLQKNLADFLFIEQGRVEEAFKIYVNILAANPHDVETLLIAGHICVALKKFDDAKEFYAKVLALEPDNEDAGKNLQTLTMSQRQRPSATPDFITDATASGLNIESTDVNPEQSEKRQDEPKTAVSIIISLDGIQNRVKECLKSIQIHTEEPHELLFVDQGAAKGMLKWARQLVKDKDHYHMIECGRQAGWAGSINRAIQKASGDIIVLAHNDVVVPEDWLKAFNMCLKIEPNIGVVGPMSNRAAGIQQLMDYDEFERIEFESTAKAFFEQNQYRRVVARKLSDFCLAFRSELPDKIGYFDEQFFLEETAVEDFCNRAASGGYQNMIAADTFVYHYDRHPANKKASTNKPVGNDDQKKFKEKWNGAQNPEAKAFQSALFLERANELSHKGQIDQAAEVLLNAIGIQPKEQRFYLELAQILLPAKRFQDAKDALMEMPYTDDHQEMRKIELLGYAEEGLENFDAAQAHIEQVFAINFDRAPVLNLKGILAYRNDDRHSAEKYFKRAIESDPGYGEPYTNLGTLSLEADRPQDALEFFEKAFRLTPSDMDIATNYHSLIAEIGEYSKAEQLAREAAVIYPNNQKIKYMLIDFMIQQGKDEMAMAEIEDAIIKFGFDDGILGASLKLREKLGPMTIKKSSKKAPVSLCMIIKDEEKYLARCLASVKPIVDEMIVVDTGSADRSKDIAVAFGAQVHDYEWENDFAAARNFSISKASGQWILILDGDEVISPLDYAHFNKIVANKPKAPVAYSITTRNYSKLANFVGWVPNDGQYPDEEAAIGWLPSEKVRLFYGMDHIRFEGAVHELVDPFLARNGIKIKKCSIPVHHYGRLDKEKLDRKGAIYFDIGQEKLSDMDKDINALRELAIQATILEKNQQALELWKKLLALDPHPKLAAHAYVNMGTIYNRLGTFDDALEAGKKAVANDPELKEAQYNLALAELHCGNAQNAIGILEDLLGVFPEYPPAQFILSSAYCCAGQKEKGFEGIRKLKSTPLGAHLESPFSELAQSLLEASKLEYAFCVLGAAIECDIVNKKILELVTNCIQMNDKFKKLSAIPPIGLTDRKPIKFENLPQ